MTSTTICAPLPRRWGCIGKVTIFAPWGAACGGRANIAASAPSGCGLPSPGGSIIQQFSALSEPAGRSLPPRRPASLHSRKPPQVTTRARSIQYLRISGAQPAERTQILRASAPQRLRPAEPEGSISSRIAIISFGSSEPAGPRLPSGTTDAYISPIRRRAKGITHAGACCFASSSRI